LDTEHLGRVNVLLQVFKNAAGARVVAQDKATADFLAQGGDELKEGFDQRTPFKLQSLEFTAAQDAPAAPTSETAPRFGGFSTRA
jgi:hypothetical protein